MSLTRPPLTLIQPVGLNNPNNPVKTDGSRLLVMEDTKISPDIILVGGSFDPAKGILTLVFDSGKMISVSGFLTPYSIGKGEKGDSGLSGIDGIGGVDGTNGVQGNKGLTGAQGLRGEKGEMGNDGISGDRGEPGFKGDRGFAGASCGTGSGTGGGGTGAHSHPVVEIQATGVLSNLTYLRGDGAWATLPAQAPPINHNHTLIDLGITGIATSGTYLRGDGTWATLPAQAPPLSHVHPISQLQTTGVADNTTFLRGDGAWVTMAATVSPHNHPLNDINTTGIPSTYTFLRGDGVWSTLPLTAPSSHSHNITDLNALGTLSINTYLRGDGAWEVLPPPQSHTHYVADINGAGILNSFNYLCGDGTWSSPFVDIPFAYPSTMEDTDEIIIVKGNIPCKVSLDMLESYRRYGKMVTIVDTTGTVILDMSVGDSFDVTIETDATILPNNLPAPPFQFLLRLKQGGAGNFSVTWDYMFSHPNGIAPDIGVDVGDVELFVGECLEAGRIEVSKASGPFKF